MFDFNTKLKVDFPKVKAKDQSDKKLRAKANSAIVKGVQKGMKNGEVALGQALDSAIDSNIWSWPRSTVRTNGETAGGTRNIVDTGRLKSSRKLTQTFGSTHAGMKIAYGAPYAGIVHYGGVVQPYGNKNAATVLIPGRPWISSVLRGENGIPKFSLGSYVQKGIDEVWKAQIG